MKVITPEISWHEREPVYSIDFQPGDRAIRRIASGGVDKIVRIWQFSLDEEGKGCVEFLSNLRRHTATVNVVRYSTNGELLASAGDDTAIILWKLSDVPTPTNNIFGNEDGDEDKESWVCHKTLRGHLGDVADLSWSKDNRYLVSGSVDNSAIVWNIKKDQKVGIFNEHKSYVQGVTFDPLGDLVATLSSDRSLRLYNVHSKSCIHNVSRMAPLASSQTKTDSQTTPDPKPKPFRIFHDDSLRSFFRRPEFSPDGQLLITPAGCVEQADGKLVSATFVFSRAAFAKPSIYLPSGEKATTVVRVNPQLFHLRPTHTDSEENNTESDSTNEKEWEKNKSLFCLPYRTVFAVASEDTVMIYDTQQTLPIGLLKNIHYHQISDLSWSSDGKVLVICSTDGFCTIATFEDGELGEVYTKEEIPAQPAVGKRVSSRRRVIRDDGESPEKISEDGVPFSRYTLDTPDITSQEDSSQKQSESVSSQGSSPNGKSESDETKSLSQDSQSDLSGLVNGEVNGDTENMDVTSDTTTSEVNKMDVTSDTTTPEVSKMEVTSETTTPGVDKIEVKKVQVTDDPVTSEANKTDVTDETKNAKTEMSQKVESMTIKDSSNKSPESKTPEAPKKKRIQFTTISLKK